MFQFPALASLLERMARIRRAGFSHSDIRGSRAVCASPRLFAAYHVLRRLQEPRHPPCALTYLLVCAARGIPRGRALLPKSRRARFFASFSFLCKMSMTARPNRLEAGMAKVENNGLEPLTPCLQGRRSSQLS